MNNVGDAKELAEKVLADTDWSVDSEAFVQTIDEALIYVSLPNNIENLKIYHLKD
jgi:hypothetical protein